LFKRLQAVLEAGKRGGKKRQTSPFPRPEPPQDAKGQAFAHPSRAGLPARRLFKAVNLPGAAAPHLSAPVAYGRFLMPAHGCEDSAGLSPDFPFTRDGAILRLFGGK